MGVDRGPLREVQPEPSPDDPWVDLGHEEDEKRQRQETSGSLSDQKAQGS